MNKAPYSLAIRIAFSVTLFLAFNSFFAQPGTPVCPADYNYSTWLKNNPGERARIDAEMQKIRDIQYGSVVEKTEADTMKIVPVVVHVLHYNGVGWVNKAQVQDALDKLNIDMRRMHADTTATRSYFKKYAVPLNYEFRLAKLDPNGNCTDGITYTNTLLTYNVRDSSKLVSYWPQEKYFNFWLVISIDASMWPTLVMTPGSYIAGYEQFPWMYGINKTYGAVVTHFNFGSIGTAAGNKSRTVTHEIGHCLGLWHPWQDQLVKGVGNGCVFNVGTDCTNNDDMVCDVPPMKQPTYTCDSTQNTCNNDSIGPAPFVRDTVDQVENFMSYSSCTNMFTKGQRDRLTGVFNTYAELKNLVSPANHIATGTNDGFVPSQTCVLKSDFYTTQRMICPGTSVTMTDASWNGTPTTWTWNFPGGSPASSNLKSPSVTYSATGVYNVTLQVGDANGTSAPESKTGYIRVVSPATTHTVNPFSEGFETTAFPPDTNWIPVNYMPPAGWQRTTLAAATGSASMMMNNFTGDGNEVAAMITPSLDFTGVTSSSFSFKVAYAQKKVWSTSYDKLNVSISTDCGRTWTTRYSKNNSALATRTVACDSLFIPTAGEWRTETVSIAPANGKKNVRIKFEFTNSFFSNNMYIDDINVIATAGINDNPAEETGFTLYPNPSDGNTSARFTLSESAEVTVKVFDVVGKEIAVPVNGKLPAGEYDYTITSGELFPAGIYFVRLSVDQRIATLKLIVK